VARLISLLILLLIWHFAIVLSGSRLVPEPSAVASAMIAEARSGALFLNLGVTLARVVAAFVLAMIFGTALGLLMGRSKLFDRFGDPWLVVLLNLPALVIIVLAYIWFGLNESAAIGAVALNKLPNTTATLREGARALDTSLDEMAKVFAMCCYRSSRLISPRPPVPVCR
jgi:NitT/TauT family transport system permease protein